MRIKCIRLIDSCVPGYFSGSPFETLEVPLYGGMMWQDLKEDLIDEYSYIPDHIDIDIAGFELAVDELFAGINMTDRIDLISHSDYECMECDGRGSCNKCDDGWIFHDELVYAYFALIPAQEENES